MINRNAYTSLLESIQEATTAPKVKVAASTSSPVVRRQKDSMGAGKKSVQWGDPAIGGAMNATELAQFLNKQSEKASGTSQSTSTDDNVLGSRGNGSSAMRSSTSTPSAKSSKSSVSNMSSVSAKSSGVSGKFSGGSGKSSGVSAPETGVSSSSAKKNAASLSGSKSGSGLPKKKFSKSSSRVSRETSGGSVGKFASTGRMSASRTVADSVEYALNAIVEENLMEWPLMINGILVHNATQLAGALNSNPSGSKAQGKISSAQGAPTPTGSRPKTRPNMSSSNRSISGKVSGTGSAPRAPKGPGPGASVMDSVEWDELDEILAEGIELYGEDTFAEILADFVDTGELSEELADLLD